MTASQPLVISSVSQPAEPDAPAKTSASARRRAYEALAQTDSDLSFMGMMMAVMNAPEVSLEVDKPHAEKAPAKAEAPKETKEKPTAKVAESAPPQAETTREATEIKSTQDKDTDMLTVDGTQWSPSDVKLLMNWVQNPPATPINTAMLPNSVANAMPAGSLKNFEASMALQEQLKKAYLGQRPLRVTLDNDAHVILRFARDGRVSAEFVASTQAADMLYRQQLAELRDRLESKQLNVGLLSVRRQNREDDPNNGSSQDFQ